MPVFQQYNTIFIHIPKTGGQTINHLLRSDNMNYYGLAGEIESSHMTATQLKQCIPQYSDYFSFTFVRNPWDRLVSEYSYRVSQKCFHYLHNVELTFDSYVEKIAELNWLSLPHWLGNHLYSQYDFTHDTQGKLLVDQVERFEDYENGVKRILCRLGLSIDNIPHINSSRHCPYTAYYTDKTKEIVSQLYRKDIETFGYSFRAD